MSDQDMHFGKPKHWMRIGGVWYEKVNSGFLQPVDHLSPNLSEEEQIIQAGLQTHTDNEIVDYSDVVSFRKGVCRRVLEDYDPERTPEQEEVVESYVAVGNCPAMIDDYRFFPYTSDSRDECECLALFDIFSSLRNPETFLASMAYGQRLVTTVNLIPKDIWASLHNWKRRDNILEYWIHYKQGSYQTYFNQAGFEMFLTANGFEILFELDTEENGMGGTEPNYDENIKRSWDKRIDAFTFAAVKVVE